VALLAVAAAVWHRMEADRQRLLISMQLDAGRHQLLEDRMAMVRDTVERYSVIFAPGELHPVNLELVPLLGPLEHMASVSGMSLGTFDDLYGNRTVTVRAMLDGTEKTPPLRGATRVIWGEALGLWQMRAMDHQRALATFDEASADAARVLQPDDPIHTERLARLFWFTVEFGLIHEDARLKLYGSGLISSEGEGHYALQSPNVERRPFDLERVCDTAFEIHHYQPILYVLDSFEQLADAMNRYATKLLDLSRTKQKAA